jgi:hypothetical protein
MGGQGLKITGLPPPVRAIMPGLPPSRVDPSLGEAPNPGAIQVLPINEESLQGKFQNVFIPQEPPEVIPQEKSSPPPQEIIPPNLLDNPMLAGLDFSQNRRTRPRSRKDRQPAKANPFL